MSTRFNGPGEDLAPADWRVDHARRTLDALPNFRLAGTHRRWAMCCAPSTGRLVAELTTD